MAGPPTVEPPLSPDAAARTTGLRTGWTTGTCASAAAKAAVVGLVGGTCPSSVEVGLPGGRRVSFAVETDATDQARAVVVKDAGDDPDCTDGARVTARASWSPGSADPRRGGASAPSRGAAWLACGAGELELRAGAGVGVVTRPGLGLEVGGPSITAVPRRMIAAAVGEVPGLGGRTVTIELSVPGGEQMATKTTNGRLGIVGGISILGTTGIVRPFSTAAYRASVVQQIDVAAAGGERLVVLATGSRSDAAAQRLRPDLDPVCFVEVGDYTGVALRRAAGAAITDVLWVGMVGKIAKLAAGVLMTHFHRSNVDGAILSDAARAAGAPTAVVSAAMETPTARHFFEACLAHGTIEPLRLLCVQAAAACAAHVHGALGVEVVMVDFDGAGVVARSGGAVTGPTVTVVGVLDPTALGAAARAALAGAEVIVGGEPQLLAAGGLAPDAARRVVLGPLGPALDEVAAARAAGRRVCVLASGDPGFFGIVRALGAALGPDALVVHPATSSVAVAFARLGLPWDDAAVISAHGRPLAAAVRLATRSPKVAILTGPDSAAEVLAAALLDGGAGHEHAAVCERLGAPDEAVTVTDLAGVAARRWDGRAVVLLWSGTGVSSAATVGFGLPTTAYAHRDGMITKPEVRSVVLGLLDLPTSSATLWDIGAGSGAVAIECARLAPGLEVIAVEADATAASSCADNARRHGVAIRVVRGAAPDCLATLPDPDRVFVGGGGIELLAAARARVTPAGRLVATHAALDRAAAAASLLGELVCVTTSAGRRLPDGGWRLEGANPVFVTWGPGIRT